MLKNLLTLLCMLSISQLMAQISLPPSGGNQKSVVTQYLGSEAHVTIVYNSPDVTAPNGESRKGKIWGQLVPWGMAPNNFGTAPEIPWRAGANENTVFKFSHDVKIQGKELKAGKYGFHLIPRENEPWTLIFSFDHSAWGSYYYNPEKDALRVQASPQSGPYTEWLSYEFTDRQPDQLTVALKWDELSLPFTIELPQMKEIQLVKIEDELRSQQGFVWNNWNTAANYALQVNALDQALEWADAAINAPFIGTKNFTTLSTKAQVLMKMDQMAEADKVMDEAIAHPTATPFQIHTYGRQLVAEGHKEKAMEVFEYNYQRYDKQWPTHVGMARGLSAIGKYDKALEHAKMAHAQAPDELNKNSLSTAIEKLKKKEDIN